MQQVNLYLPEFAPSESKLTLRTLMLANLSMLILLLFVAIFLFQRLSETRKITAEYYRSGEQIIESIVQVKGDRQAQLDAAARKEGLKTQIELQSHLLADLQSRANKVQRGFSPVFHDLALVSQPHAWLTHIQIDGSSVKLNGETTNAKVLPEWIAALQATQALQGKRFAYLKVSPIAEKIGVLSFELSEAEIESK